MGWNATLLQNALDVVAIELRAPFGDDRIEFGAIALARDEVVAMLRPVLCDEQGRWTADYMRLRFAARAR